ncbi:MAG: hypothetical protein R6U64_04660 [Bacteroidales bacterium]
MKTLSLKQGNNPTVRNQRRKLKNWMPGGCQPSRLKGNNPQAQIQLWNLKNPNVKLAKNGQRHLGIDKRPIANSQQPTTNLKKNRQLPEGTLPVTITHHP